MLLLQKTIYTWYLDQNIEYLEIQARVRPLIANCKTSHETRGLLELNGWKSLDRFETDDNTLDVWCAPKNWRVEMEIEGDGWDSNVWFAIDV